MLISSYEKKIINWDGTKTSSGSIDLINEEPLSIRLQGNPYSVIMRTPGEEIPHAAGFCLGEGIVDYPSEIGSIGFCDNDTNVITITLTPEKAESIPDIIERRGYVSQTSCGICGKELIEDLQQRLKPMEKGTKIDIRKAYSAISTLSDHQKLRKITRASHGAALHDINGTFLSVAEDAGRHNAVDKVIGKLFLEEKLEKAKLLILSSRISYELVQKAARAGIPVIVAVSRPTNLAVELASSLNMTLACLSKKNNGLKIFCNDDGFEIV